MAGLLKQRAIIILGIDNDRPSRLYNAYVTKWFWQDWAMVVDGYISELEKHNSIRFYLVNVILV